MLEFFDLFFFFFTDICDENIYLSIYRRHILRNKSNSRETQQQKKQQTSCVLLFVFLIIENNLKIHPLFISHGVEKLCWF